MREHSNEMTGKAAAVVQDAEAYHRVLDIAASAEVDWKTHEWGGFGQRPSFEGIRKLSMV